MTEQAWLRVVEVFALAATAVGGMIVRQGMKDDTSRKLRADLRESDKVNDELRRDNIELRRVLYVAYRWVRDHMEKVHDMVVDPAKLIAGNDNDDSEESE